MREAMAMTIEIGGNLLTAGVVAALVVLVVQWWKYRYLGRRG